MAGTNSNEEFVQEFLVESTENLDQLDRDLIALEQSPADVDRLASIFRTVHTIKGNSGFFGFSKLGALTHSGEHLLGKLRDGKLSLDERVAGSLYSMVDAVRAILRSIEATGNEGDQDFRELAQTLAAVAAGEAAAAPGIPQPTPEPPAAVAPPAPEPVAEPAAEAVAEAVAAPGVETGAAPVAAAGPSAEPHPRAETAPRADSSVRVDVGLVSSLLDLVGELVLARNQLRSLERDEPAFQAVAQRINAVTNALQETVVRTRLQPIDQVFSKFPRTVRDLAVSCGKEVHLAIDGADTELDRTLIESIRDPLTHLVRNAVDHGIEPPAVREAAGKPRSGTLSLRAFNESGQVTIEMRDDGAGIDVDAVRAKAVSRGLVTAEAAKVLPDERILQYIFEPGFSTAAKVTAVSGRGVGMDVVKTNIEAIGGTVDLQSRRGAGTLVRVRVPLTLAIMPALVVRCGPERLAIPQAAVRELVPLRPDCGGPRIEGLAGAPVVRLRGRLLPVVFLDEFLAVRPGTACREDGTVVVVRVDDHEFGIVVEGLRTRAADALVANAAEVASLTTIVIKPIGGVLGQAGIYAGATVLGDGRVVLILDLRGLARLAAVPPTVEQPAEACALAGARSQADDDRYLVCRTAAGRRIAVPLSGVRRLEAFAADELHELGARRVVRRGDGFTPVIDVDSLLGPASALPADTLRVVVLGEHAGGVGLVVRQILDVEAADSPFQPALEARGVAGALSLGGVATEVLDLDAARAACAV